MVSAAGVEPRVRDRCSAGVFMPYGSLCGLAHATPRNWTMCAETSADDLAQATRTELLTESH